MNHAFRPYGRKGSPLLRGGLAGAVAGLLTLTASACSASDPATSTPTSSASAPAAGGVVAKPGATPSLPAPTGPHRVGTTSLHLKDTSRPDPWAPEAKARELMVTLWYPTRARDGEPPPYMTPKESELVLKGRKVTGAPYDILSKTRTNAVAGAEPAGTRRSLPLVVLSPGFTMPRSTLTSLAEELAGGGYVVAGVDHTYENYATTFPDGRVAECAACDADADPGFGAKTAGVRAADVSFVLDELTGPRPTWAGASLIDPSKIAMAGQSIGGASAVAAMLKDSRVRAGIDMDGSTYARIPKGKLSRPFLFLGSEQAHSPGGRDNSWDRDWKLMTGWKRWLVVSGADHQSFTDVPVLAASLGIPLPGLAAGRSVEITRAYVRAFLDLHLLGKPQPLLDKPSTHHPEVRRCVPENRTCA
ncbi:alpha/beta hydrolase family protein [Rhizohabitans arisaemae]|uniref:alpha/beta hydrolase family protein n=1 Tax=Rhizohabitans arisaemae TaxID=2720610 RepID=UPI0024B18C7F|nr:alpha/beta hydrolase [Rhizohabitans arisaemae]